MMTHTIAQTTEFGVFVKIDNESIDNYGGERGRRTTAWIQAFPVVLNYQYQTQPGEWRFCGSLAGKKFEHLCFDAMIDSDSTGQTVGGGELRARDIYSAHSYEIERMLKSMKSIERKLSAMYDADGMVLSFGQAVARFAKAIGAKTVIIQRSKQSQPVTGERWKKMTVGSGVSAVDRMISNWQDSKKPAAETTNA